MSMTKRVRAKPIPSYPLLPGEPADIVLDAASIVADTERWLDTPNIQLLGRSPREMIGTEDEWLLRNLIRSVKHGIPT